MKNLFTAPFYNGLRKTFPQLKIYTNQISKKKRPKTAET